MTVPVSVLNLVPRRNGGSTASAIEDMVRLAQGVEAMGYTRYWIAEHHNMGSVVSSATQILIGHTLGKTQNIRVGSGGVMLPNHSPLAVAEQYGTLASIYPGRVDLGLGRAPGTDRRTAAALRRHTQGGMYDFAEDIKTLQIYLGDESVQGDVRAYPGIGTHVPLYILGSSTESAYLAAELGLPYVFAAHFAPRFLQQAAAIYRHQFRPSAVLAKPKFMVCLNVIAADTEEEARFLQTTQQQYIVNIARTTRQPLQPPVTSMDGLWTPEEESFVRDFSACSLVGSKEQIASGLGEYCRILQADEVIAVTYIYDVEKQLQSYRILKDAADTVPLPV